MHEFWRFLFGIVAIVGFSFGAVALLVLLVRLATPGERPESSWVWRATQPLVPLFTRLGLTPQTPRFFVSDREAKEYLVGVICAEAERQQIPMTEVERKMLYESRSGWTLPAMEAVREEFHRSYNPEHFERKIFVLERKIVAHRHHENPREKEEWDRAVEKLNEGDHYLRTLLNPGLTRAEATVQSPHHVLKLWLIGLGIVLCVAAIVLVGNIVLGPRV